MSVEQPTKAWYTQTWIAVVALLLFFPLGLFLMWRFQRWEVWIKTVITVAGSLLTILFIVGAAIGEEDDTAETVRQEASPSPTVEATAPTPEPTPTPEEEVRAYSALELMEVRAVDGDKVLISGTTDLPEGASLTVYFDVAGRSEPDLYTGGVGQDTTVTNGEFSVTLPVPQRDEFVTGPYEISVSFFPRLQPDDVIRLVGEDGENLTGGLVDDSLGFRTMWLVETRELDLSVAPPSYVFQLPSEFAAGSAERALAEYVFAWENQDWSEMVKWSQKTWQEDWAADDPAGELASLYDFKTLKGFEIRDVEAISEAVTDITFVVHYEAFPPNEISKKQITARVIRETAPYEPSPQGEWGVNPLSTLRETDVD